MSKGNLLVTSNTDEWYTPKSIIDRARRVMGGIDLDPASCEEANSVVEATKYYTKEDDGLSLSWFGRVWLNPPYGKLAQKFTAKLLREYSLGNVPSAVLLVNSNALGAKWGQMIWDFDLICCPSARIHFWNSEVARSSSTHGSLVAYLGGDPNAFIREFQDLGRIVKAIP